MATSLHRSTRTTGDERFFLTASALMVLIVLAGFSFQFAMGRSSFAVPWPVHLHAILFMGWVAFFGTQVALATTGSVALHKRLGWLALPLIPALVVVGTATTIRMVRLGHVPFFFTPGYFLVMNPTSVILFAALAIWAIRLRRRTDWHRRLMLCAMAMLMGPAFGRLLPMPFLIPVAGLAAIAGGLAFPIAGAIADKRRTGRVHPAWLWGLGFVLTGITVSEIVGRSALAGELVALVAAGSPGATVPAMAYPPFPPM